MYILYNQDGSVLKKNLTDYIQKGNNNVNEIFVSIVGIDYEWTLAALFELPNGDLSSETPTYDSNYQIDGQTYEGWVVPITAAETIYEGILKLSLQADKNTNQTLFTTSVKLVINPAVDEPDETTITYAQYASLLNLVNQKANADDIVKLYRHHVTIHKSDDPSYYPEMTILSKKATAYTLLSEIYSAWNSIIIIDNDRTSLSIAVYTNKISQSSWSKRMGNIIRRVYKEYNLITEEGTSTSVDLTDSNAVVHSDIVQEIL